MWIFSPVGYFSAVCDKQDPETVWVRARFRGDLDNLRKQVLPTLGPTVKTPVRDYLYRAKTTRFEWAEALAALALSMEYTNFKDEVTRVQGGKRHNVYLRVWGVLNGAQHDEEYPRPQYIPSSGYAPRQTSFTLLDRAYDPIRPARTPRAEEDDIPSSDELFQRVHEKVFRKEDKPRKGNGKARP